MTENPCKTCARRHTRTNWFGAKFEVCDCSCGQFFANSGHPLSPCMKDDCIYMDEDGFEIDPDTASYEPYRECEIDEEAVREGGRCSTYITWLYLMGAEANRAKKEAAE